MCHLRTRLILCLHFKIEAVWHGTGDTLAPAFQREFGKNLFSSSTFWWWVFGYQVQSVRCKTACLGTNYLSHSFSLTNFHCSGISSWNCISTALKKSMAIVQTRESSVTFFGGGFKTLCTSLTPILVAVLGTTFCSMLSFRFQCILLLGKWQELACFPWERSTSAFSKG